MDWIDLAQDRDRWRTVVNALMILGVPLNAWNFLTRSEPVSFSRRTLLHGVRKLDVSNPESNEFIQSKLMFLSKNGFNALK